MNSNAKQRLKQNLKYFSAFIYIFLANYSYAQDTTTLSPKLSVFELIGGVDFRTNSIQKSNFSIKNNSISKTIDSSFGYENSTKRSYYEGVFFRIQTSFIAMYFQEKFKKFHFGELVTVEASMGYSNSVLKNFSNNFQTFYNCELGFFSMYRINKNTDIWLSIAFFRFNRDYFANVESGSNYLFKIRHKKWIGEISWVSENKMYFGEFNKVVGGPNVSRAFFGLKYFFQPRKIIGMRLDISPINGYVMQVEGKQTLYSLKLFYGIHF